MRFDDIAITSQTISYHSVDKEFCKSYGIKLISLNPTGNEQWHVVRMIRCIRMFHGSPFWIFEAFATRLADPGKSIIHLILLIYASTIGQCWPINGIIKGGILGYYKAQLIWTWDSIQFASNLAAQPLGMHIQLIAWIYGSWHSGSKQQCASCRPIILIIRQVGLARWQHLEWMNDTEGLNCRNALMMTRDIRKNHHA
jgi:hypothetical protein